jgi:hypothetical protein
VPLLLPKNALNDVKLLLTLEQDKLRGLDDFFSTAESLAARRPDSVKEVAKRLRMDISTTETALFVCQFLLSFAEDGVKPEELVNELVEFVSENAPDDKTALTTIDRNRQTLFALLTPKPLRSRALKVEYLAHGPHPTVDSFRSVCDLRPVFETVDGKEVIVGYVPAILLETKVSDSDGSNEQTILLFLTSDRLQLLKKVVERTEEKLNAIRAKFGENLLHD